MENNLQTREAGSLVISGELFQQFVEYIDRSEKTTRAYLCNLRQFAAWLHENGIAQPDRSDIKAYRDYLAASGKAASTRKQYMQAVKLFFKWTAASGAYPNIADNIHTDKVSKTHRKDSLQPAEVLAIENSITEQAEKRAAAAEAAAKDSAGRVQRNSEQSLRLRAMYLLAVCVGLRTIELSRAKVKDIELKSGRACLWIYGKGRSEADQRKPLPAEVYEAIREYLHSRTDSPTMESPLFVSTGNRSGGKAIAPTTISTMLKEAMKEAGFDSARLTAHSLRHTAAQNALEVTGKNIFQVQRFMRHQNASTTEVYLEADSMADDTAITDALWNRYHSTQAKDASSTLAAVYSLLTPEQLRQLAAMI